LEHKEEHLAVHTKGHLEHTKGHLGRCCAHKQAPCHQQAVDLKGIFGCRMLAGINVFKKAGWLVR
jgi:hypothetical protein